MLSGDFEMEASTRPMLIIAHEASVRTLRQFLLNKNSMAIAEREQVDETFAISSAKVLEFAPRRHAVNVEKSTARRQTLEQTRFDGAHAVLCRWPCHIEII